MEKIELAQALDNTGMKKQEIAKRLGFNRTYYSRFVKRGTVNSLQAREIERLTGLEIEMIDVEVK